MSYRLVRFSFYCVVILFTSVSCNSNKSKIYQEAEVIDGHNAQNSLDWAGRYIGSLPCADCEAIETTLTLNKDQSYVLTTRYVGKEEEADLTYSGSFVWDGSLVKLEGIPKNARPNIFKVEENRVRQLDMDGQIIVGEIGSSYLLQKVGNTMVEDKRWQIIELNGKKIDGTKESHYIILNSNTGKMEASVGCNRMSHIYKITNEFEIKIELGISTKMACPDGLEQNFLEVIQLADNISTDGNMLSFNKGRMAPLVRFKLAN